MCTHTYIYSMCYETLYLVYSKLRTWQRQLPTLGHSSSSSILPFKKIRGIVNGNFIDTYGIGISTFSYGFSILHNTCKYMLSMHMLWLTDIPGPIVLANYHWLHCHRTFLGKSNLHTCMYLLMHVGLGRQAGAMSLGRIRRERNSNSLTHVDNDAMLSMAMIQQGPGGCWLCIASVAAKTS